MTFKKGKSGFKIFSQCVSHFLKGELVVMTAGYSFKFKFKYSSFIFSCSSHMGDQQPEFVDNTGCYKTRFLWRSQCYKHCV